MCFLCILYSISLILSVFLQVSTTPIVPTLFFVWSPPRFIFRASYAEKENAHLEFSLKNTPNGLKCVAVG